MPDGPACGCSDVLDRAGVKAGAVQVRFNGLDEPVVPDGARFHEVARHRSRARRRGDDRLRDERRAAAAAERLSAAPGRARLVFDLLGQDAERHRGAGPAGRQFLDDDGLSHSRHAARQRRSRARPGVKTVPINRMVPRSFFTNITPGDERQGRRAVPVRGIAFGGDSGVARSISRPMAARPGSRRISARTRANTASGNGRRDSRAAAGRARR